MTRSASPLERSPIEKSSQRLCTLASWSRWIRSGLGPTGSSAAEEPSGQYFLMMESWLGLAYLQAGYGADPQSRGGLWRASVWLRRGWARCPG